MKILSGDQQSAQVGAQMPAPLVVKVLDAQNRVVSGQVVNFVVTAGGGSVFGGVEITNDSGVAQERWTLGTSTADSQRVEARAVDNVTGAELTFAVFQATALPGAAATATIAAGGSQSGSLGVALPESLAVRVADRYANPVPGQWVRWSVLAGGGSLSADSTATSIDGVAKVSWSLGSRLDTTQVARAVVGAIATLQFTAIPQLPSTATITKTAGDAQTDTVGHTLPVAPSVTVRLADGRAVTGATVTFGVDSGGGSATGTNAVTNASGVATVGGWTLGTTMGSNKLHATVSGLPPVVFSATATAGPPIKLSFSVRPGDVRSGAEISPAVQVTIQDASGNAVTNATTSVTLAITSGTGTAGAVLGGTLTQAAVSGVATFSDLTVDKVGTGYTLAATATSLTSTTSSAFAVTPGAAAKLAFTVQPTSGTVATAVSPAVQVAVQDAQGNTVTPSTASITLAIGTNPGVGTLSGTVTVAAVSGVASFSSLSIDKAGTGYTLVASATGLTAATSTAFSITGTAISGVIAANTTWDLTGSPYIITGTVQVASAATLTIDPGVEVRYANGAMIQLAGSIVAIGTSSSRITFTSVPPSANSNATMFQFLASSNLALSSFSYATFEKAATAIGIPQLGTTTLSVSNSSIGAPIVAYGGQVCCAGTAASSAGISISGSTISNTTVSAQYPHPVRITITGSTLTNDSIIADSYADMGINILNSTITGGSMTLGCCGAKLHIEGLATGVTPAVRSIVSGSRITDGGGQPITGPLEIVNTDLTDVQVNLPAATGTFTHSSFAYDAAYGTQNQITIGNGTLSNCRITGNGKNTGLVTTGYAGYSATGNYSITYTDITQNGIGISAASGSAGTLSMSNSNLTSNSLVHLQYLRSASVTLSDNWWGTTDTTTISSLIYDGHQNILYGIVTYAPILTAPQGGTGP